MVPSTWLSVALFVFLIAPGLLFDLLAERRRAGRPESAFREASRVVLASLAFTSAGIAVISLVRASRPAWMPDPGPLLADPQTYAADHYGVVLWALAVEMSVALGAALAVHRALARKHGSGLRAVSSWHRTLREDRPGGADVHVRVKLTNGTIFVGKVAHYTADLDMADREIVLAPPLFSRTGDKPLVPMPPEWQRLVLAGSVIESLAVQYRPQP